MATLLKAFFETPAMTRCECADLSFDEIRQRIGKGQEFEDLAKRTGCGRTCTACVPDLEAFLAKHGRR